MLFQAMSSESILLDGLNHVNVTVVISGIVPLRSLILLGTAHAHNHFSPYVHVPLPHSYPKNKYDVFSAEGLNKQISTFFGDL